MADIPDGPGDPLHTGNSQVGDIAAPLVGAYVGLATFALASFLTGFQMKKALASGFYAGIATGITVRSIDSIIYRSAYHPINEAKLYAAHGFIHDF